MKKMYFVWALAMCLVAAGCSKDEDRVVFWRDFII